MLIETTVFIVVRPKKADLRPLSPYYCLRSPSSISEKSLQTNAQSYVSKACRIHLGFLIKDLKNQPPLQCHTRGIYRLRGGSNIPQLSGYLHLKIETR